MTIPTVLTLAGSDSGGGAGIQADLKAISALGGYGLSVITALTAQNTLGVQGIHPVPAEFVGTQCDAVFTDIGVDAAKTGMLAEAEIIRVVAQKLRAYRIEKIVVDPVMIAKGGARLLKEEAQHALITELLPLAYVVTPNLYEAEALTRIPIATPHDMQTAARIIHRMGASYVIIKGGHLPGDKACDLLYDGERFHDVVAERIDTQDTHGTGCTFSAAIATGLAQGKDVLEAVTQAKQYLTTAIRFALHIGHGHGPVHHTAALARDSERYRCIQMLKQAVNRLKEAHCGYLIPEVQSNIGYALSYAADPADVAAIPGRMVNVHGELKTLNDPEFGASRHIARIILTLMRTHPEYRSAMNIRFSEDILTICQMQGFAIGSFNRTDEPQTVKNREGSSLEWGVQAALSQSQTIPDIVFDRGDIGKEPMIRVLGKTPGEVVEKVVRISQKLT